MFSRFTLPERYDKYGLVTRLWLQSRVVPVPDNNNNGGTAHSRDEETPPALSKRADIAFVGPFDRRPWSLRNIMADLNLVWILLSEVKTHFFGSLDGKNRLRVVLYVIQNISNVFRESTR